jgi:hypothetical protein
MLAGGMSVAEVKATGFLESIIEIYALVEEADAWSKTNGKIQLTDLELKLVKGELDPLLKALAKGGKASSIEKAQATSASPK